MDHMGLLGASDMRGFVVLALDLLLSGCMTDQTGRGELFAPKSEIEAKNDATCRGYGAKPGDPVQLSRFQSGIQASPI